MIPDETVERVREASDIVEVIGEHVKLKRAGGDWRGPCPFHGGKNPNFSVSTRRSSYHCFKCGVSGDVFTFVREHLGMDFVDAVKYVAAKYGIPVVETRARHDAERDPREPLWEANGAAAELFQRTLWESSEAEEARAYLASRAVSREIADRFRLGFATRGRTMHERLGALGFDDQRLLDAGLLARREEDAQLYPRFRDRLMIPILDVRERVVGFGGRVMSGGDKGAKYLNSPETATFSKGQLLYNLHAARGAIRKLDQALVVEGYFDVIRLAAAGVEQVVAGLGTALTADQAALIARHSKNVFLLYDSDKAGQKATFRAALELLRIGASVRVVTLPPGEDPDSFVQRHGGAALGKHLDGALDVLERQVQLLERGGWFGDLHKRRRAIDRLLPTLRATSDAITRDVYLARVSEVSGVERAVLMREIEQPERGARSSTSGSRQLEVRTGDRRVGDRRDVGERAPKTPLRTAGEPAERELVRAMLEKPSLIERAAEREELGRLRHPLYAEIFTALLDSGGEFDLESLASTLSEPAGRVLQELIESRGLGMDPDRTYEGSVRALMERRLDEESARVQREIESATSEDAKNSLLVEKTRLGKRRKELEGKTWGMLRRS